MSHLKNVKWNKLSFSFVELSVISFLNHIKMWKCLRTKKEKKGLTCYCSVSFPQLTSRFNIQVMASQQGLVHSFKTHTHNAKVSSSIFFPYRLGEQNSGIWWQWNFTFLFSSNSLTIEKKIIFNLQFILPSLHNPDNENW